jgi:hypothetical protein
MYKPIEIIREVSITPTNIEYVIDNTNLLKIDILDSNLMLSAIFKNK